MTEQIPATTPPPAVWWSPNLDAPIVARTDSAFDLVLRVGDGWCVDCTPLDELPADAVRLVPENEGLAPRAAEIIRDLVNKHEAGAVPDTGHPAAADAETVDARLYRQLQRTHEALQVQFRKFREAAEIESTRLIDERDHAQDWVDTLAAALAPDEVLGDHSNANNPWENALNHALGPASASPSGDTPKAENWPGCPCGCTDEAARPDHAPSGDTGQPGGTS